MTSKMIPTTKRSTNTPSTFSSLPYHTLLATMSEDPGVYSKLQVETEVKADDSKLYPYLSSLNPAQLKGQSTTYPPPMTDGAAVTSPPNLPLQILAGPGSGKTRVLTSRVAHLVKRHGYRPMEITAVTFTNKAANEMKKRLAVLLGAKDADALILGKIYSL